MSNPLISIIVPVYNAERTIERCVSSLISKTVPIEVVCIDDGSTDGSLKILNNLSDCTSTLVAHHQPNAGAGEARNAGLKCARGEYVMFCDSDDCFAEGTIDIIAKDIEKYQQDYLVFHRKTLRTDGSINCWGAGEEVQQLDCEWYVYLNSIMCQRSHGGGVVNKVFKRSIIEKYNIHFERFKFGEDWWFILTYIRYAHSFVEDYSAYYIQHQTSGSICLRSYPNYIDLNMEFVRTFRMSYPRDFKILFPFFASYYYGSITWAITRIMNGWDVHGLTNKLRAVKALCARNETSEYLSSYMESRGVDELSIKKCKWLVNQQYIKYLLKYYYLLKIKSAIIRVFKIKL